MATENPRIPLAKSRSKQIRSALLHVIPHEFPASQSEQTSKGRGDDFFRSHAVKAFADASGSMLVACLTCWSIAHPLVCRYAPATLASAIVFASGTMWALGRSWRLQTL